MGCGRCLLETVRERVYARSPAARRLIPEDFLIDALQYWLQAAQGTANSISGRRFVDGIEYQSPAGLFDIRCRLSLLNAVWLIRPVASQALSRQPRDVINSSMHLFSRYSLKRKRQCHSEQQHQSDVISFRTWLRRQFLKVSRKKYTPCLKKGSHLCLIITLANVDQFSKFFHRLICKKILPVYTTNIPTCVQNAICCSTTLWNSKIQKNITDFHAERDNINMFKV